MAGSQSKARKRSAGSAKSPGDHAREAVSEWGDAIRHGTAALAPVTKTASAAVKNKLNPLSSGERSLADRMNPTKSAKGGRMGDAADALLAKFGKPGKLASKASLGSRAIDRLTPDVDEDQADQDEIDTGEADAGDEGSDTVQVPIQESIEVAIPLRVAWDLATSAKDYPEFLDRVSAGKRRGKKARFDAKVHGAETEVVVEVLEEQPQKRIAWKASGGHEHTGVASFHELAPDLTHIEVSIVLESEGMIQKLARFTHLTQHAVRSDLNRFKAYAELEQDQEEIDKAREEAESAQADENETAEPEEDEKPTAEDEGDADAEESPDDADESDEEPADEADDGDEEPEAADDDAEEEPTAEEGEGDVEQADVLDDDPPHAYSDVLENYQSREAYADVTR